MASLLLKTCVTVLCGELVMALTNYSLPFVPRSGSPFLHQGVPFGPAPTPGPPTSFSASRTAYSPPTYLPPDTYREVDRGYGDRSGYYGNFNKEARQADRDNPGFSYPTKNDGSVNGQNKQGTNYRGYENQEQGYPGRPGGFTRVEGGTRGGQGNKAQVHAVLDYDEDYYEDDGDSGSQTENGGSRQPATPIQGPIFLKNGSVPVVPLYSYPVLSNGTFVQIPILWSALSVALGLEVRGQLIRGVPCVKRYHQLFCPTAGSTYPLARIESFIDENKALMKRMYGDFTVYTEYGVPPIQPAKEWARRDAPGVPDPLGVPEPPRHHQQRFKRQSASNSQTPPLSRFPNSRGNSSRIDACESKMEIITPYWALNSAGKVRAVVNTMHFEQAIHQEVCSETQTHRCAGDCGCEQKYKWHRLLAYNPDEDCAGIFMDWFLFPSCCVCRCNP